MKTLTDGPADAINLATGAVGLGWRVTVVNPDLTTTRSASPTGTPTRV